MRQTLHDRLRQLNMISRGVSTDALDKPFLEYLIRNTEYNREELDQLKRKINQIKTREYKQNMEILNQASRDRLRDLILPEGEEAHEDYLENLLEIIANQFSKEEVLALVSH